MLVLQRDRVTGALKMSVEINPTPAPAWSPPAPPQPNTHRDADAGPDDDVDWVLDAVGAYVHDMDLSPLDVAMVHWSRLLPDLREYVRATR